MRSVVSSAVNSIDPAKPRPVRLGDMSDKAWPSPCWPGPCWPGPCWPGPCWPGPGWACSSIAAQRQVAGPELALSREPLVRAERGGWLAEIQNWPFVWQSGRWSGMSRQLPDPPNDRANLVGKVDPSSGRRQRVGRGVKQRNYRRAGDAMPNPAEDPKTALQNQKEVHSDPDMAPASQAGRA